MEISAGVYIQARGTFAVCYLSIKARKAKNQINASLYHVNFNHNVLVLPDLEYSSAPDPTMRNN